MMTKDSIKVCGGRGVSWHQIETRLIDILAWGGEFFDDLEVLIIIKCKQ